MCDKCRLSNKIFVTIWEGDYSTSPLHSFWVVWPSALILWVWLESGGTYVSFSETAKEVWERIIQSMKVLQVILKLQNAYVPGRFSISTTHAHLLSSGMDTCCGNKKKQMPSSLLNWRSFFSHFSRSFLSWLRWEVPFCAFAVVSSSSTEKFMDRMEFSLCMLCRTIRTHFSHMQSCFGFKSSLFGLLQLTSKVDRCLWKIKVHWE